MRTFKKKQIINGYIFMSVLFLGVFLLISAQDFSNTNGLIYLTFIINGIVILCHMFSASKLGYSLIDMFDIFMLFFMFVAPVLQYVQNGFPWEKTYLITDEILILSNIIIFLFLVTTYITYSHTKKKNERHDIDAATHYKFFVNTTLIHEIGFYFAVVVSIYIIQQTGFFNLFSRSTNYLEYESQTASLIVGRFFKAFPLIMLLFNINFKKIEGHYYRKWQYIILFVLTVLLHFPTGLPRFQVAVVYLALMIAYKQNFKNKYLFKMMVVFGLLIIFPIINIFRNNSFADLASLSLTFPNPVETFVSGDFDAYSMLNRAILYVKQYGISFGNQLLGAVFFFVPRFLWTMKPVGTGQMVAESMKFDFTNVSMPYIGEAYINFGVLGIFLFSLFIGKIISHLDFIFPELLYKKNKKKIYVLEIIYPLLIGYLFFIMRGDLLSSFAYTMGYTLPVIFLYVIDKVLVKLK